MSDTIQLICQHTGCVKYAMQCMRYKHLFARVNFKPSYIRVQNAVSAYDPIMQHDDSHQNISWPISFLLADLLIALNLLSNLIR